MSRELEAVWTEINELRAELDALKVKREMLARHQAELVRLSAQLQAQHLEVVRMADEVTVMLEGEAA